MTATEIHLDVGLDVRGGSSEPLATRTDRWLHRERLLEVLDTASGSGLALVIAPLGSGKTTLLQQWALGRSDEVHWVSSSDDVDQLVGLPRRGATVVVDDAQCLGGRALSDLALQIEHTTPGNIYVIAARSLPPFNLAHREFPVPVLVTQDDLQFRPPEIADLYGQVYGAPISEALCRELARTTQGWAAALYLRHLSDRPSPSGPMRIRAPDPPGPLLVDPGFTWSYLAREVLAPLPPPLVHFLQLTCGLDPLTVQGCDLLLSWNGSREALREIAERSGLVRADPEAADVFHCHPVLRAHLQAQSTGGPPAHGLRERAVREIGQDIERLDVRCLGAFQMRAGGRDVDFARVRPSARTVVRILAVRAGAPVHREELVELLWPDRSLESGIHNLHVAISSLRHCLEGAAPGRSRELVARCGDAYVLAPDTDLVTDIQRLELALQVAADDGAQRSAALGSVLELYAGDVLPADGPAEWVVGIRDQLRQRVADAAAELAGLELDRGHLSGAVAAAKRSIELDPWNDAGWRRLIEGHVQAGDPAREAMARRSYRRRLHDLGVDAVEAPGTRQVPRSQGLLNSSTSPSATRWFGPAP